MSACPQGASCNTKGCKNDHGPVCPDGSLCPNKDTSCRLYHVPRDRAARKLNAGAQSFIPASSGPSSPQAETPPPASPAQAVKDSPVTSKHQENSLLKASALPFRPLPQSQLKTVVPIHQPDDFEEDEDYYDSDLDEFADDNEFEDLVDSLRHEHPHYSEQEIEAMANEYYYSKRVKHQVSYERHQTTPQQENTSHNFVHSSYVKMSCPCCEDSPLACQGSPACAHRGVCVCVDDHVENAKLDTWVPASCTCSCCKGFIYRCEKKNPGCNKGQCNCAAFR